MDRLDERYEKSEDLDKKCSRLDFEFYKKNCSNYIAPDYVVTSQTPWKYRCKNFLIKSNGYLDNCLDCRRNNTDKS